MAKQLIGIIALFLVACASAEPPPAAPTAFTAVATFLPPTATAWPTATQPPPTLLIPTATPLPTATHTPVPTLIPTATPVPTQTRIPTAIPTATPVPSCIDRIPADDLYTVVTRNYALSAEYEPADLVNLSDYFSDDITFGFNTRVRAPIVPQLVAMMDAMYAVEGLEPTIISGYRSYIEQHVAWIKWAEKYPDRVGQLSAPAGTSEHQLGTTVDFGSPVLNNQFHTNFYLSPEGQWLAEHAHQYGFTLSYPLDAYAITQFYYEPWHFRFVGVELAMMLHEAGMSLTEYQLATMPPPCIP